MIKLKDKNSTSVDDKCLSEKTSVEENSEILSDNYISTKKDKDKPKQIKEKCNFCNKKLKMIHFTCRCYHKFCIIHQNPHSHKCSYDSKSAKKIEITNNNPILSSKIERI